MPNRKNVRDLSRLSGRPLKETVKSSHEVLQMGSDDWLTSPDLTEDKLSFSPDNFYETAVFLMANPNVTSSHLFRADILFDSEGTLKTPQQDEELVGTSGQPTTSTSEPTVSAKSPVPVSGFDLVRTVIRKLIPRNQNIDKPLVQTCHFHKSIPSLPGSEHDDHADVVQLPQRQRVLTMFLPHVESPDEIPFYHPQLRGLATLYDCESSPDSANTGVMSLHFLPFSRDIPERLERTLHILLNFYVRLTRGGQNKLPEEAMSQRSLPKDNLVPRHRAQNTYARLKTLYAADLCANWVESTEPSKHVYEDLAITAFLIELWRIMYGIAPAKEEPTQESKMDMFPGFVDMACGNGVLVYVLLMEGYSGCGFDARRRKSWNMYPAWVQERLAEKILIPKPFADATDTGDFEMDITTGDFPRDTFIISNHADELTVWTPLIAALACPESPLPFLAIPCCSHSLSGARYRYPLPKGTKPKTSTAAGVIEEQNPQPASGDLKALRAAKHAEKTEHGIWTSMYGLLTAKTIAIAEEAGYQVEKTLLRIPSTRNMGVVGGRQVVTEQWSQSETVRTSPTAEDRAQQATHVVQTVMDIVERECSREGGIKAAARIWVERARSLQKDRGNLAKPANTHE